MLWKFVGRWALAAVAVPLTAAGARRLGRAIETRHGSSRATRLLHRSADMLQNTGGRRRGRRWRLR